MFDWLGWLRRLEFTTVAALAIAALCLVVGQAAERFADANAPSAAMLAANGASGPADGRSTARFNVIDYATTGSVKERTVVLSPCKAQD